MAIRLSSELCLDRHSEYWRRLDKEAGIMTDKGLEAEVQVIFQRELENYGNEGFLQPATSIKEIAQCQEFLGRDFSPSYRHFLCLHNGWIGFQGGYRLLGTRDYHSSEVKDEVSLHLKSFLEACNAPTQGLPNEIFFMENLYRLVDSQLCVATEIRPLKKFMDDFRENSNWLCLPKHTIIAVDYDSSRLLLLDNGTTLPNGEREVVEYFSSGGFQKQRWINFYELINFLSSSEDGNQQMLNTGSKI